MGLDKNKNEIIGNLTKIKFDVFNVDGHKYIIEPKPIFYDIATGENCSLALGMNNRQILYYWGKGTTVLNANSNKIIHSTYPLPINRVENIKKIYARFNLIGTFSWDRDKNINVLYVHGIYKFGIDAGIGIYNKPKPVIVFFSRDKNINVESVNFSDHA